MLAIVAAAASLVRRDGNVDIFSDKNANVRIHYDYDCKLVGCNGAQGSAGLQWTPTASPCFLITVAVFVIAI